MTTIPILEIADVFAGDEAALAKVGAELRTALTEVGFFFVTGHGVDRQLIDDMYRLTFASHALEVREVDNAETAHAK